MCSIQAQKSVLLTCARVLPVCGGHNVGQFPILRQTCFHGGLAYGGAGLSEGRTRRRIGAPESRRSDARAARGTAGSSSRTKRSDYTKSDPQRAAVQLRRIGPVRSCASTCTTGRQSLAEIVCSGSRRRVSRSCHITSLSVPSAHFVLLVFLSSQPIHYIMSPLDQPSNASSSKRTLDPPASSRSRRSEEARARARREISRHRAATRARQDSSAPAGGVHPYGLLGYVTEGTLQHQYSFPIGTLQQQPPYLPVTDGSFAREGPAFMGLESEDLNGALLPAISHNGRFHSPWTVPERGLDDTSMPPQEVLPATIDPALLHSSSAPALLPILSAIPTDTPPIPSIQLPELPNVFHSGSAHMQAHLQPSHPSVRLPSQDAAELPAAEVEEPQAAGPSARSVLHNVDRHNQPIAGPSSEHARRVQPKRASKRKQEDHENRPVVITADGRSKRQRLTKQTNAPAPAPAPAPAATAAAKEPVRTRRKNCELEVVEVTPGTRCQLDGCTAALPENVAKARQHMLTHFRKVAVPANDTPKKQGARKGKKKASSRTAAPTSAEPQTMKMVDKYPCPFTTAEGGRCGDHPRSQYADRLGLQRHIEGEHYKWEVRCPICRETFRRRDALTRHRKTVDCQPPPPPAALPETGSTLEPGADSNSDASSESATDSESDSDSD